MKGASRGLEGGLRRASRGLQGGLRRASRGLEKGFKGASRGLQAILTFVPPPGKGPFKPPLKGTFEGGGSDPAPLCGMPREWIAELAGESAIVPTYRNGAAPFGGSDCPSRTSDPGSGRTCGAGNGTEVSPSLSENSGRSRTPTRSGVCSVTEDGSMTMFDSGGNLLILELACGVDSVIQNASREFGSSYIGIHAGLELL